MEMYCQIHALIAFSPHKVVSEGRVGSKAGLEIFEEKKNISSVQETKPQNSGL
jgi:hypothetical protein